jgi:hypothetical protein
METASAEQRELDDLFSILYEELRRLAAFARSLSRADFPRRDSAFYQSAIGRSFVHRHCTDQAWADEPEKARLFRAEMASVKALAW